MPEPKPFERLPGNIKPLHYNITLQPNLVKCVFHGSEEIDIEIKEATKQVKFNTLDLTLRDIKIRLPSGEDLVPASTEISTANEMVILTFDETLPIGTAKLSLSFDGELNDKMKGMYRSKYTSVSGEERYSAVTQFEATDARRCFPCWDEPALKATFSMTLIVPHDRVPLSNMPEISRKPHESDPNLQVVKFGTSPLMSTYLVAVVVGEYDFVEDTSTDGIKVRVYTPVGKQEQGKFALDVATKVLPYYKEYFSIAYPLPKIDLIAIADFSVGAMENWGLVTYRETCLLVDPHNTSASQRQWIALVVGHELAHQWFGNLVTMEWWTHLWLNEGYATFVEFLCVDHLFPEYDIWTQFVSNTYIRALELDGLKNSHPIEVPVGHPSEVDEIFDDISYNKGASVIRMLHCYLGDQDFRAGMNKYLTRHQYANTYTEDLWAALSETSNKPVGEVMSTWTKQTGFPMISVSSHQDGDNRVLSLTQQRFLADGSTGDNNMWMVPISISTEKNPSKVVEEVLLEGKTTKVVLDGISSCTWVKLNPGTVGYYRIQYPPEMLAQLIPAIQTKQLPPLDRLGIFDDLFSMVQAGHTSTVEVLKVLRAFEDETDYTVWSALHNCVARLNQLLSHTDFHHNFAAFVRNLFRKISQRLGWEAKPGEKHLDTLLRSLVLGQLGLYGEESVVTEAKKRLLAHVANTVTLPADLRSPVYKTVVSQADEKTYEQMLKLYREADLHEEKDRISRSLGATRDPNLIQRVLQFAMSSEVRNQDTIFVIISVAMTAPGRSAAWAFFKKNHQELLDRYEGGYLVTRLIRYITENFASEEMAAEVENFFRDKQIPGTERTVQQSLETIRLNAAWLQRDQDAIKKYLAEAAE
ncbi:puromycin-sensitive aminopeptidase-like isoform X2 [Portunus trituberculatus]|uniref:puromycin-sensitive aminopeptidase-like isoform X2 n=1 Tax=Portunus trituberculatus TaxID=210409 RepID=UPI001E1D1CB9|nr:puromycin-sensitive aminopeptidase-like isoform X2 [Portunus trituberculatus]XP_045101163.1 puromycin-sensitive aminopeptidase-like isoform X2 [Portunus trituberculatus]